MLCKFICALLLAGALFSSEGLAQTRPPQHIQHGLNKRFLEFPGKYKDGELGYEAGCALAQNGLCPELDPDFPKPKGAGDAWERFREKHPQRQLSDDQRKLFGTPGLAKEASVRGPCCQREYNAGVERCRA